MLSTVLSRLMREFSIAALLSPDVVSPQASAAIFAFVFESLENRLLLSADAARRSPGTTGATTAGGHGRFARYTAPMRRPHGLVDRASTIGPRSF